ncbi:MAG: protein translocase SEC61 complex subunit gamma [Candidatus Micrarchaeota archaeon]|nr:protein translocase SEC61 complex subunit gamma [Candidatus Micrarchaeota archaeon]
MNILELISRCIRIILIARKPTEQELGKVAKITAIGIVVIGLLGIIISLIFAPLGG